jgi:hypothetical protein
MLAGVVLAFPGFAIFLIVVWLSVSLLFSGIEGVIMGWSKSYVCCSGGNKYWSIHSSSDVSIVWFISTVCIHCSAALIVYGGSHIITGITGAIFKPPRLHADHGGVVMVVQEGHRSLILHSICHTADSSSSKSQVKAATLNQRAMVGKSSSISYRDLCKIT